MLRFILFSQELQNHRPSVSKTRDCEFNIKGRFSLFFFLWDCYHIVVVESGVAVAKACFKTKP